MSVHEQLHQNHPQFLLFAQLSPVFIQILGLDNFSDNHENVEADKKTKSQKDKKTKRQKDIEADRHDEDEVDRNGALEEEVVPVDKSQTVAKGRPNCSLDI